MGDNIRALPPAGTSRKATIARTSGPTEAKRGGPRTEQAVAVLVVGTAAPPHFVRVRIGVVGYLSMAVFPERLTSLESHHFPLRDSRCVQSRHRPLVFGTLTEPQERDMACPYRRVTEQVRSGGACRYQQGRQAGPMILGASEYLGPLSAGRPPGARPGALWSVLAHQPTPAPITQWFPIDDRGATFSDISIRRQCIHITRRPQTCSLPDHLSPGFPVPRG